MGATGWRRVLGAIALLAACGAGSGAARAQAAAPTPAPVPTIKAELLFVQNARGVVSDPAGRTLTLNGLGPTTLFFTDRPVRVAGHYRNAEYLSFWKPDHPDSFAKNPPNAVLSVFDTARGDLVDVVVTLANPRLKGEAMTYDVKVIRGKLPRSGGPASLFIDRFAMGFRAAAPDVGDGRRWGYVGVPCCDAAPADVYQPPSYQPPNYQAPTYRTPVYGGGTSAPLPEVIHPQ